jgi:hypothetical protein
MFKLHWAKSARMELAQLWTTADPTLRRAITIASHEIDQQLIRRGDTAGESRGGDRRILFETPLAVTYRVFSNERRIRVSRVWLII